MSITEAMSATDWDESIHGSMFPFFATPKVDGIRFFMRDGEAYARSGELIPNKFIRSALSWTFSNLETDTSIDGELIIGDPTSPDHFQNTSSGVMSHDKLWFPNALRIFPFDYVVSPRKQYRQRVKQLQEYVDSIDELKYYKVAERIGRCAVVTEKTTIEEALSILDAKQYVWHEQVVVVRRDLIRPTVLRSLSDITRYLNICLNGGYEGIILRKPEGHYKFGRSTANEALLLRLKPLADGEAVIIGFQELMHNENTATIDALGKTKRSASAAGKVCGGVLGSFLLRDLRTGIEFSVGGGQGVSSEFRQEVWDNQEAYLGLIIRYQYLASGTKPGGAPRMPKFNGFRDPIDMQAGELFRI